MHYLLAWLVWIGVYSGTLRAKFELSQGPGTPSRIAVQFVCNAATISKLNFDLSNPAYKLSLVKKKITTGEVACSSQTVTCKCVACDKWLILTGYYWLLGSMVIIRFLDSCILCVYSCDVFDASQQWGSGSELCP